MSILVHGILKLLRNLTPIIIANMLKLFSWWRHGMEMLSALLVISHYSDVIMTTMASQITSLTVVYSTVYSDGDQRKHQSSASLAFVWGIHRDRWIPRTKGQLRGKCFHLMTSSCEGNHGRPGQEWGSFMVCFILVRASNGSDSLVACDIKRHYVLMTSLEWSWPLMARGSVATRQYE